MAFPCASAFAVRSPCGLSWVQSVMDASSSRERPRNREGILSKSSGGSLEIKAAAFRCRFTSISAFASCAIWASSACHSAVISDSCASKYSCGEQRVAIEVREFERMLLGWPGAG
jgi:hypothetical protein